MKYGETKAVINGNQINETLPIAVMEITKSLIQSCQDEVGTYIDYPSLNISVNTLVKPPEGTLMIVGTMETRPRPYTAEELEESMRDIKATWNRLGWEMEET